MMPVTLRITATVFLLCGICALDVTWAEELVWWKSYVTSGGKKVDGEGARSICVIKAIVDLVSERAFFLESEALSQLSKAKTVLSNVTISDNIRTSLTKKKQEEILMTRELVEAVRKHIEAAYKRTKEAALDASRLLSDILKWHCIDVEKMRGSPYNYSTGANCDPDAFSRERFHYYHVNDRRNNSILCDYKVIRSGDTVASFETMGRALDKWNFVKPKPNLTRLSECWNGQWRDEATETLVPCMLRESWLEDYNASRYSMRRLYDLTHVAVRIRKYAEMLSLGEGTSAEGVHEEDKAANERAVEERSKHQAAGRVVNEARNVFEDVEKRWLLLKRDAEARSRDADAVREAESKLREVTTKIEELSKALEEAKANKEKLEAAALLMAGESRKKIQAEKDAKSRLREVEKEAEISKKALEGAETEMMKADDAAIIAQWEAEDTLRSCADLKKEVYQSLARVSKYDKGDEVFDAHQRDNHRITRLLVRFIILLLLLGSFLFFVIRGRREMQLYHNIHNDGLFSEERAVKDTPAIDAFVELPRITPTVKHEKEQSI
ncbi:75 kDa invariant surface glycoprotein, putative [Trypanosoma equiperdum]|uniref:Invariant surface glycoprotein, putative n=2 Tax=Trypanozoon TaxID=39700 RepID=Q57VX5_TRYB2|nr:75 kDa invariant surface glycoprotein, putative [Trypanosoma brucei brucei TREU927]AAX70239.1 75 kDa invariant surface glycoprotein, putative [Trypanosoma brucei]AAZ11153.1 75 kDa invariant surface glycoprotein, putative [Trypanosoma brucei brucei TREU927]CAQ55516.1 invariant surface glycoprotein, putative [Trypanosoma brucei brucei TREU927]SCU72863.1 75 kDa invariant surface glycoprotein, putative [Trypanosoma equiperdum]